MTFSAERSAPSSAFPLHTLICLLHCLHLQYCTTTHMHAHFGTQSQRPIFYLPFQLLKGNMMRLIDHRVVNHSKFVAAFSYISLCPHCGLCPEYVLQLLFTSFCCFHLQNSNHSFFTFLVTFKQQRVTVSAHGLLKKTQTCKELDCEETKETRAQVARHYPKTTNGALNATSSCVVNQQFGQTQFQVGTIAQLQMEIVNRLYKVVTIGQIVHCQQSLPTHCLYSSKTTPK